MAAKKSTKKSDSKKQEKDPTKQKPEPKIAKKKAPKKTETKAKASPKKAEPEKKAESKPAPKKDTTIKDLEKIVAKLEKENARLKEDWKKLLDSGKEQKKQLKSLEGKMDTRTNREDILMDALKINARTKKGQSNALSDLSSSLIKTDEHLLKLNKRMENVLSAIKNHREYLIRLNKRVYKEDPIKLIDMELDVMCNTLNVMALSGFNIDKALFNDVKKIRKLMEKKDMELAKLKTRMSTFTRKFDEEMERFDLASIYKKAEHIPGYR